MMGIKDEVLKEINKRFNVDSTDLMESEKVIDLTLKKVEELIDDVVKREQKRIEILIFPLNKENAKIALNNLCVELKIKLGETG